MRISKSMTAECSHILDLPRVSKCNKNHGHSYSFKAIVEGPVSQTDDMVLDYSILGDAMKEIIDKWDHGTFIPESRVLASNTKVNWIEANYPRAYIHIPREDAVIIPGNQSTAENIAKYFWELLQAKLMLHPPYRLSVEVQETQKTSACYP